MPRAVYMFQCKYWYIHWYCNLISIVTYQVPHKKKLVSNRSMCSSVNTGICILVPVTWYLYTLVASLTKNTINSAYLVDMLYWCIPGILVPETWYLYILVVNSNTKKTGVYHPGRKYKDRCVLIFMYKRPLYFIPEWYICSSVNTGIY